MTIKNKKIDQTLLELIIGILFFFFLCQIIGIIFIKEDIKYSAGLWIGAILACVSAYHMWWSLNRNLSINGDNERGAQAYGIRSNMIRYGVILIVFLIVCLTDFAYPLSAFLGIMGLKAGAYLTPLVHKVLTKRKDKETQ